MKTLFKNKQLMYLFLCNFGILFIGFGLFPLLPLYASKLGASPTFIGIYLAITYIAISLGSLVPGQLAGRVSRKAMYAGAALLGTPAVLLLGHVQALWQLVALTAVLWFSGGVGISISNVLTGLHANASERGKAFGWLGLTSPLGALIGGLAAGQLVELNNSPLMFAVLAAVWSIFPLLALTVVKDKEALPASADTGRFPVRAQNLNHLYLALLVTVLLGSMTVSVGRMGLSMEMKAQAFSSHDLSMANALAGLVTIPLTLLIGTLSDTLGRRGFLLMGYLAAAGSTLMLAAAHNMWEFHFVSTLVLVSRSVISSMAPAYASDLINRRAMEKALPLINSMNWISGVIGFALSGVVLERLGPAVLYGGAAILAMAAGLGVVMLPGSLPAGSSLPIPSAKKSLPETGD